MEMIPVDSSNLESIGYDSESSTLEIHFKQGSAYQYFDVPERIYDQLLSAESPGRFLSEQIKGVYRYSKV